MNDDDWRGFPSAFDRAVRPDVRPAHSGARVLAIGFAVVVAVGLAALMRGALGGGRVVASPGDVKPLATSGSQAPGAAQTGKDWTAVAGPGCDSGATSGFSAYGYYTGTNSDQTTGWSTSSKGGYSGGSCTGSYLSLPVSGQPASYDKDRFALWRFDFSATYTSASCTLATYVPNGTRTAVGGDPAYYYYSQTDDGYGSGGSTLGGYRVDQVGQRGRWVTGRPFKVRTGLVTVKLVDAGARDGGAAKDAHVAAAQVRITCHAV
jgi:translation initiation factor IF-2